MNPNDTTTTTTVTTRIAGVAAVAGPVLLLASTVSYIAAGDGLNDGELGGAIQVWAFIALGLAIVGLSRTFERAAPRAAAALTVFGVIAAAVGSGYGIDSLQAAVFDTTSLQETDSTSVPFALQIPGLMAPASLAALGIVMARVGAAPKALGWLLAVGAVLFPASRMPDVEALAVAGDALIAVALAPIGFRLLAGRRTAGLATPAAHTAVLAS